ncbi:MAG: hypothetical protein ABJF01_22550 [bacterium]
MRKSNIVAVLAALAIAAPVMAEGRPGPVNHRSTYGDRVDPRDRAVYQPTGRVFTINGRRCVRETGRNGAVRTVCADGDHDRDDRTVARADHRNDRGNGHHYGWINKDKDKRDKHDKFDRKRDKQFDNRFDQRFDKRDHDGRHHH